MNNAFVGFMDKAQMFTNDQSNILRQVVNELQIIPSRLLFVEGTKDDILSLKENHEDHLKSLESQLGATSEMSVLDCILIDCILIELYSLFCNLA